ncbi:DNA cytosine methyltransferase [uncultured Paracoccus sp.]|uniref:DNA cytosine methyltransferase n=1 Tax=uncultured Paracoccus sp. TaxID=189685 RepID=UPI002606B653|nr:DNA cytosine methyltransferase [uncultured Paracoccus sp.]
MTRKILVADLLCGAGGSSTGCERALAELGLNMELVCVNHWPTAIETHQKNHPEARHYVQDIATVRPHLIVPEGYLDLLMASPTCTHHSVARGGKPTSDQQRSDPWHIITWLTELRVKRIIIENVWEFLSWGPVDRRTGKPVKSRKGEYFHAWIETIRRLGFDPEWRKLNAADYGDATTRQRFILMARSDGRKVHWPMPTHRKRDEVNGDLFSESKPWRPAREIIDWNIRGKSIFGRKKPLAPKTLARIYAGAVKFEWPEVFILLLAREIERSLLYHIRWTFSVRNAPAKAAARRKRRALARDLIARLRHFRVEPIAFAQGGRSADPMLITLRRNGAGSDVSRPLPTIAANGTHIGIAEPIVLSQHNSGAARTTGDPLPTITTGGAATEERPGCARPMLVEPFVVSAAHGVDAGERNPHERRVKSVDEPLGTLHAGGGKFGIVEPFILNRHGDGYGETRAHSVEEPAPTANCDGGGYLVEPFVLSQASGGAPRTVSDPIPTAPTGGAHALVTAYYGGASTCSSDADPLPTVTTKDRFGIIVPVTHGGGEGRALDVDVDGLPTITGANRGELAFITAQFGEREGQAPRTHSLDQPLPVGPTLGQGHLVEPTPHYDILFRMLEPHELAAAMGFTTEETRYEFAGTKTEQIKQIGNAVSVAKMKACVGAIMADAAPKTRKPAEAEFREAAE